MITEYLKLFFFVLGLICIGLAVTKSLLCLIPAVIFWVIVHFINWVFNSYPMDGYFDHLLDPANFFENNR